MKPKLGRSPKQRLPSQTPISLALHLAVYFFATMTKPDSIIFLFPVYNQSSPNRQDRQMVSPETFVVAVEVFVVLAPVAELLVQRIVVAMLGQPEVPGGRRTAAVAVAGENIFKGAFVFNGVYILSLFARRQSAALHFDCAVMTHGFRLLLTSD